LLQNFRVATNIKALEELCKSVSSSGGEKKILVLVERLLEPVLRANWQLRQENVNGNKETIFDSVKCDFIMRSKGRKARRKR
jgi:hypothetical protein